MITWPEFAWLHVIEGSLVVDVEGGETTLLKTGEAAIIPADIVHLARNENTSARGKALVVRSRSAKDKPLKVVRAGDDSHRDRRTVVVRDQECHTRATSKLNKVANQAIGEARIK